MLRGPSVSMDFEKIRKHRGTIWYSHRVLYQHPEVLRDLLAGSIPVHTELRADSMLFEHSCFSEKLFPKEVPASDRTPEYTFSYSLYIIDLSDVSETRIAYEGWKLFPREEEIQRPARTLYLSGKGLCMDKELRQVLQCQAECSRDTDSGGSHEYRCPSPAFSVSPEGLFLCKGCARLNHKKIDGFYSSEVIIIERKE